MREHGINQINSRPDTRACESRLFYIIENTRARIHTHLPSYIHRILRRLSYLRRRWTMAGLSDVWYAVGRWCMHVADAQINAAFINPRPASSEYRKNPSPRAAHAISAGWMTVYIWEAVASWYRQTGRRRLGWHYVCMTNRRQAVYTDDIARKLSDSALSFSLYIT